MNAETMILAVHPPIPQKHLGRYRNKAGVYLIRQGKTVIYIGRADNLYKTIMRLFQKQGVLYELDINTLNFEIVLTPLWISSVKSVLKRLFTPYFNQRTKEPKRLAVHEKNQNKRILECYLEQSQFDKKVKTLTLS